MARLARAALGLDEVWFIPCARSADGKELAPGALRLRWLRQALRGRAGVRVCDLELRRGGVSRTVDTVRQLRAALGPGVEFTLLLGQDQALRLPAWKQAWRLAAWVRLAVFARPGWSADLSPAYAWTRVAGAVPPCSSRRIRATLARGGRAVRCLPPALVGDASLRRRYGPAKPKP